MSRADEVLADLERACEMFEQHGPRADKDTICGMFSYVLSARASARELVRERAPMTPEDEAQLLEIKKTQARFREQLADIDEQLQKRLAARRR